MDAATSQPTRLYWVPPGVTIDTLPEHIQVAIAEIVNPAYRALVLEEEDPLARSAGTTLVHLLWLEVLAQLDLGEEWASRLPSGTKSPEWPKRIEEHLRLIGAKHKVAHFLLQWRMFRDKCENARFRFMPIP